jgi:hypothetical protein
MASVGLIVAGATSAGGLAALAVKLTRKTSPVPQNFSNPSDPNLSNQSEKRSSQDDNPHSR